MIAPLVLLALFVGAWELYTQVSNVDAFILPAPHEVAQSLWDDRSLLLSNLGVTAQEVGLGVVIALLVGGALAVKPAPEGGVEVRLEVPAGNA